MITANTQAGGVRSFALLLCRLRWFAVAGQAMTIYIVTGPMGVALTQTPLWAGVAVLALFNLYLTLRLRLPHDMRTGELFAQLIVDIGVLGWLIGWSGGIENPFVSLFVLPIALSILSLPTHWTWAVAAISSCAFALSVNFGVPLPHVHGVMGDTFNLHKVGMLVSFLVSAAVLLIFMLRMAALWRYREQELALLRERFTRNEGIVALATHAASVAHELNTPLATLTLMVDEIARDGNVTRADADTMRAIIEQCRFRVRALAAPADTDQGPAMVDLEEVIDRWLLVRPTINLRRSGSIAGHERVDRSVGHLLQTLLNNAADASLQSGTDRIDLKLDCSDRMLYGEIRDYGPGFSETAPRLPGTLFRTTKPDGLGIGLVLSHATVEHLGGELSMAPPAEGSGVRVNFRLPVSTAA
jgi:two-component system sensor histidine kinase RegB